MLLDCCALPLSGTRRGSIGTHLPRTYVSTVSCHCPSVISHVGSMHCVAVFLSDRLTTYICLDVLICVTAVWREKERERDRERVSD